MRAISARNGAEAPARSSGATAKEGAPGCPDPLHDEGGVVPHLDVGDTDDDEAGSDHPRLAFLISADVHEGRVVERAVDLEDQRALGISQVRATEPVVLITDVDLPPETG